MFVQNQANLTGYNSASTGATMTVEVWMHSKATQEINRIFREDDEEEAVFVKTIKLASLDRSMLKLVL